ncbi:hemicentin-1 isoform X1 [Vanessa atalanta]|uniref:hemicentin-1 isoform X1 n=2 Tax=Vanessa atalanta TaxID=42275 RepID=UPI001FCDC233|nr:hemicentin-1 isoform X1 [Vanessa atalanta]XP_047530600.1 hemicentin-1 isoform X1 [Vanessa atalanta]
MGPNRLLSPFICLLISTVFQYVLSENDQYDAREGEDITMQCRFALDPIPRESITYYWVRNTFNDLDNVAIGDVPLETNYQIMYAPSEGRFDLKITNVTYERDNGQFECRVKAGGSGRTMHSQGYNLVVLTQPQPPVLNTGPQAQAQEGRQLNLTCSSVGGSPSPIIKWYRDGSIRALEAEMIVGKTRVEPTVAVLTLEPSREDDGATFRCDVKNRAMREGQQLEATVDLSVNYFPRVEIGPENPLRVEVDGTANMVCKVDAKPKVSGVRWTREGKYISNSFNHMIQRVTVQDAGKYICSADNGLGHPGENEIYLDVLYPPNVVVDSKTYEAEEGGNVEIKCEVSSNPEPISIEWTMEGRNDFRQKGNILLLTRVNADMAGTYVCRAVNVVSTSTGNKVERAGSASVAVLVRHKPGQSYISPDNPVAQEGMGVTLTCSAKPPGWPVPQYRWFREIEMEVGDLKPSVLATGNKYVIPSAHLGSEGVYHCQATNELGHSELATVNLEVHQPPRFQSKLQPHMIKNSGERNFSLTCVVLGKPLPNVKWYKDNAEIRPDANLYEVKTEINKSRNAVFNIQSVLWFHGRARPNGDDLLPADRGVYSCSFENEVKKVDSSMQLRIEHEPISVKQQKKVAYDLMENAEISCRVQAYPKPEFQWFYGATPAPLQITSDGHYEIITTTDENDSYLSVLMIRSVRARDYGDYYCKVKNSLGNISPQIRLQPKGAPEPPKNLASQKVDATYVTLKWEEGFNGGLTSTKYFVWYRRVRNSANGEHCSAKQTDAFDWKEYDCGRSNPCNVTHLDQHNSYYFKVKAVNTKGQSNYSNEISVTTKVDRIIPPDTVHYNPSTRMVRFTVAATCLPLVGVIEKLMGSDGWQVVDTMPLSPPAAGAALQEKQLDLPAPKRARAGAEPAYDADLRLRLKLCLQNNQNVCSDNVDAQIGTSFAEEAITLTTSTLVAIIISSLVFLLCLSLLVIFCRCKRNENKKETSKDYEMDSMRSPMGSPQNQAPPPYYPSTGMENKALENSMDIPLTMDDSKNTVYATQGGYGYHIAPHTQTHPGQNMTNTDWVNMGYIENSYANSNNGGSVNSQDSLWQMKMAAANNPPGMSPHQMIDRQSNYGYDPIAHGGYGTIDDYASYPPLPHGTQLPAPDYGLRNSQNPSRQDYCSDPYASVHKPKKRMDQHIESPYHEVSGLPDGYAGDDAAGEDKPPHLSLSYDESLESGYSTPNSRARRVIREIIV